MQNNGSNIGRGYASPLQIPPTCSTNYVEETEWSSGPTGQSDSWKSPQSDESWRGASSVKSDESWVQRGSFPVKKEVIVEPAISNLFLRQLKGKRLYDDDSANTNGSNSNNSNFAMESIERKKARKLQCFKDIKPESAENVEEKPDEDFEEKVKKQLEMMKQMEKMEKVEKRQRTVSAQSDRDEYEQDEYEEVDETEEKPEDNIPSKIADPDPPKPATTKKVVTKDLDFEQIHFFGPRPRKTTPTPGITNPATTPVSYPTPVRDESWMDQYRRRVEAMKQQLYGSGAPPPRPAPRAPRSFFFSPMPISTAPIYPRSSGFNNSAAAAPAPISSGYSVPITANPVKYNGPVEPINNTSPAPLAVPKPVPAFARKIVQEKLPPPGLVSESYFRNEEPKRKKSNYNGPVGWDNITKSQNRNSGQQPYLNHASSSSSGTEEMERLMRNQPNIELDSDDEDNDTYARLLDMFNKDPRS